MRSAGSSGRSYDEWTRRHAKDRHADGTVAPAGKGVVDWPHFLHGLEACGFDGPLIAHGMSQSDAPAVAEFLTGQVRRRVL